MLAMASEGPKYVLMKFEKSRKNVNGMIYSNR